MLAWVAAQFLSAMTPLDLGRFLPYRLSVLANKVSVELATVYAERFDLSIAEWRVLAVLGQHPGVSADFVCGRTEMDRVTVSRAVAKLLKKRYIRRRFRADDRRHSRLDLAAAGGRVYAEVVPLARRFEAALIAGLDAPARAELERSLVRLESRIDALAEEAWRHPRAR
jgi:DNA-binding MarR family transcriptional regulator